jgi:membrane protein CcdC involved in cytochrome C biogenesis
VNLPIARAVLSGCLTALRWMLWVTAALLFVLFVIAYLRPSGESPLRPIALGVVVSVISGWISGWMARQVENQGGD